MAIEVHGLYGIFSLLILFIGNPSSASDFDHLSEADERQSNIKY